MEEKSKNGIIYEKIWREELKLFAYYKIPLQKEAEKRRAERIAKEGKDNEDTFPHILSALWALRIWIF